MTILAILEVLCVVGAIVFGVLWVNNPAGNFEPSLALSGSIAVGLDLIRRYRRSKRVRVFLSVGATYNSELDHYVNSFEKFLTEHNCDRIVVGRDKPAARQPILQVRDQMKSADAVIVLAFTRYVIKTATEKPDSEEQLKIKNSRLPTVWNQIEAAIGFGLGRPLLVIYEEGMKQEAMLKDRFEFKTIKSPIPLDPKFFDTPDFKKRFQDFIEIARKRSWRRL